MPAIQLYSVATANGQKAAIMLEECGADYAIETLDLRAGEHRSEAHMAVNPFGRLPAIVDHEADDLLVYGTLPICQYLTDRYGCLMPEDPRERAAVYQWAGFVATDLAPAFAGLFAFTVLAPEPLPWALETWEGMSRRMLGLLDDQLARAPYVAGASYTYVDVLTYPVAVTSVARLDDGLADYPNVARWRDQVGERGAVQRGMEKAGAPW